MSCRSIRAFSTLQHIYTYRIVGYRCGKELGALLHQQMSGAELQRKQVYPGQPSHNVAPVTDEETEVQRVSDRSTRGHQGRK